MNDNHTPGPWRWEMNKKSKALALCGGGASTFCLTIVEPARWGMNGGAYPFAEYEVIDHG